MTTYVYAIRAHNGAVKIGISGDPSRRLSEVATGSPVHCYLAGMVEGDRSKEAELHERFREFWIRGEWFRDEGAVADFVDSILVEIKVPALPAPRKPPEPRMRLERRSPLGPPRKRPLLPGHAEGLALAIKGAGSRAELGRRLGKTGAAISQWDRVPGELVVKVEKASGVNRELLRPDMYAAPLPKWNGVYP